MKQQLARTITSEGQPVAEITTEPTDKLGYDQSRVDERWVARIDAPHGEAWSAFGETEEGAVINLIIVLGDEITSINRLLAAIKAFRKGEDEI